MECATMVHSEVRELERLISRMDGVNDAVIVPVQQPSGRAMLKAFVETAASNQINAQSIINYCLKQSNRGTAPATVTFCKIPRTPSGKVARQILMEQHAV